MDYNLVIFCSNMNFHFNIKKYLIVLAAAVVFLAIGLWAGYSWGFGQEKDVLDRKLNAIHPLRSNDANYKFINPLLLYMTPSADQQWGLVDMKNQVQKVIDDQKKNNGLDNASIFFQDLNHGRWMGINQNDAYNPASMLKVVVMVSYLKESEVNPDILTKKLLYASTIENQIQQDVYNQSSDLVVGQKYTVEDLIEKMIITSDNGATFLLLDNINQTVLNSVYSELSIQGPQDMKGQFTISPRYYSFFFRILYSGTYLSKSNSEKALSILSNTTFKDGIISGLPENIIVAHKYGQYVTHDDQQVSEIELHDCGIIYYPQNPYLLCIMTRGSNFETLKTTIKDISSVIWQQYSSSK